MAFAFPALLQFYIIGSFALVISSVARQFFYFNDVMDVSKALIDDNFTSLVLMNSFLAFILLFIGCLHKYLDYNIEPDIISDLKGLVMDLLMLIQVVKTEIDQESLIFVLIYFSMFYVSKLFRRIVESLENFTEPPTVSNHQKLMKAQVVSFFAFIYIISRLMAVSDDLNKLFGALMIPCIFAILRDIAKHYFFILSRDENGISTSISYE